MVSKSEIRSLFYGGMTKLQIAKHLGVRGSTICRLAAEMGLPRKLAARLQPQDSFALFRSKVAAKGPQECWLWLGGKNLDGYGRHKVWMGGKRVTKQAHHVAYYIEHGKWPSYILHSCDTPACCNPAHLREGTHAENIAECWNKGRGRRFKHTHLVPKVREMIAAGARNCEIMRALGIKRDAVSRIRYGHIYGPNSRAENASNTIA